eukprot:4907811-Pyramimonas_sp.AAC.1
MKTRRINTVWGVEVKPASPRRSARAARGSKTELRNRGTPHTYIMAGVMIAEALHVRMMLVAVATPSMPPAASRERRACHALRARNG